MSKYLVAKEYNSSLGREYLADNKRLWTVHLERAFRFDEYGDAQLYADRNNAFVGQFEPDCFVEVVDE
jgi:hypothetical protein